MVYFCKYFRQYLLGRDFIIRTDHSALSWLRRMSEPIGQQSRWLEILEEFSFTVQHRSGSKHSNADAMSRRPCRQCHMIDDEEDPNVVQVNVLSNEGDLSSELNIWSPEQLSKGQLENLELGEFYRLKLKFKDEKPSWDELLPTSEITKTL